jgi:hypothetical protein
MLCNSWIIVDNNTGKGVLEIYNREIIKYINKEKYTIFTSLDYLYKMNRNIKKYNKESVF